MSAVGGRGPGNYLVGGGLKRNDQGGKTKKITSRKSWRGETQKKEIEGSRVVWCTAEKPSDAEKTWARELSSV